MIPTAEASKEQTQPNKKEGAEDVEQRNLNANERTAFWTLILGWIGIFQVAGLVAQTFFLWASFKSSREASNAASAAAQAAEAELARGIRRERAYVMVGEVKMKYPDLRAGGDYIFSMMNLGKSIADQVTIGYWLEFGPGVDSPASDFEHRGEARREKMSNVVLIPGMALELRSQDIPLSESERRDVADGRVAVYCSGIITYNHIGPEKGETRFRFVYRNTDMEKGSGLMTYSGYGNDVK
jgi:hypothetical protein